MVAFRRASAERETRPVAWRLAAADASAVGLAIATTLDRQQAANITDEGKTSAIAYPGDVAGLLPPGDIHRVHNVADATAISLHVYGADLTLVGSSIRRAYPIELVTTSGSTQVK